MCTVNRPDNRGSTTVAHERTCGTAPVAHERAWGTAPLALAHARGRGPAWIEVICALLLVTFLVTTGGDGRAAACSLDGIASLSMDGVRATLTAGTASQSNARYWAPFTLLAAARGDTVRLSEDRGGVSRSLTAAQMQTPFRWIFDDGGSAAGWTVTHAFSQLGPHRFTVSYYWRTENRWVEFDSAQLQVVRAADLLRANLGYHVENIVGTFLITLLRILVWGSALAIVVVAVLTRRRRARAGRQR